MPCGMIGVCLAGCCSPRLLRLRSNLLHVQKHDEELKMWNLIITRYIQNALPWMVCARERTKKKHIHARIHDVGTTYMQRKINKVSVLANFKDETYLINVFLMSRRSAFSVCPRNCRLRQQKQIHIKQTNKKHAYKNKYALHDTVKREWYKSK